MRASLPAEHVPRPTCTACRRPVTACYCRFVVPLRTRTRIVVLQHPRERDVPINTARIAALCLPEAEVHVGVEWEGTAALERALSDDTRPAALLYPGPEAIDVEREPPSGPITLLVVDGTWWQARKIVRANPSIARLPRYAFRPSAPSRYRIRAEPRDDYVSTIEALAHVLGVLEPRADDGYRALLEPFEVMVERQLRFAAERVGAARHRRHAGRSAAARPGTLLSPARLPRAFGERAADIVCVHAEGNAWPHGSAERRARPEELMVLTAERAATRERFTRIVRPQNPVAPTTLRYIGLSSEALDGAVDRARALAEWSAFVRPTDVVCTWGDYARRMVAAAGGSLPRGHVDVRALARSTVRKHATGIDAFAAYLGYTPPAAAESTAAAIPGRAGVRIAQLAAIARACSAIAAGDAPSS